VKEGGDGRDTEGIVALELVVHAPEAQVTLRASRAGTPVAERLLRLPMALGEGTVEAAQSLVDPAGAAIAVEPAPGRTHAIVDLFARGRWRATRVLTALGGRTDVPLEEGDVPEGLLRVQARTDRFTGEGSGGRALYVRAPGEDDPSALARIAAIAAAAIAESEPTHGWARLLPSFTQADPQRAAAFLLAPLEQLRMAVPPAASGRPAQLDRLARTRFVARFGVAGALVLSALVIGLSIARRGLSAADEAQRILDEVRDDSEHAPPAERLRARTGVLLLVLAVAAAFLAGALLIVAKPLWF